MHISALKLVTPNVILEFRRMSASKVSLKMKDFYTTKSKTPFPFLNMNS